MKETAAAQLRRILQLLPELADDQDHPIAEVAARMGVDRKTLLRDLRQLAERSDEPAGFVENVSILIEGDQVSMHADRFRRPMALTFAELAALELGLAVIRAERPPEEQGAIEAARERLRRIIAKLPDEPLPDENRWGEMTGGADPTVLGAVRRGLRDRRKLRIAYHKADASDGDERVVCPYALAHANGRWFLVAHCERSAGLRVFRVDRITTVDPLEARYRIPDDFSPDRFVNEGKVLAANDAAVLTVRYSPRIARWIAEREGVAPAADGSLTLEHPLADLDWAVRHVLQYGPDAEILGPAEAREALVERLRAMAAAAGGGGLPPRVGPASPPAGPPAGGPAA